MTRHKEEVKNDDELIEKEMSQILDKMVAEHGNGSLGSYEKRADIEVEIARLVERREGPGEAFTLRKWKLSNRLRMVYCRRLIQNLEAVREDIKRQIQVSSKPQLQESLLEQCESALKLYKMLLQNLEEGIHKLP